MTFITLDDILGQKKILYTNLDYDIGINRRAEEVDPHADRYKKNSPRKLTLVLEMVDILVKVVDINSPEQLYMLHDQSMHQVAVKSTDVANSFEVVSRHSLHWWGRVRNLQFLAIVFYSY
jgi:hypothetical protein